MLLYEVLADFAASAIGTGYRDGSVLYSTRSQISASRFVDQIINDYIFDIIVEILYFYVLISGLSGSGRRVSFRSDFELPRR